uniref:Uncharacterized protein n=1 Tax=Trypanosoma congolense (strain IL3000) TaxID=1068625 RepID=G0UQK5_TRYCI|nr:conserved hypothetical protein [Trypanosoma congolense IL3000]
MRDIKDGKPAPVEHTAKEYIIISDSDGEGEEEKVCSEQLPRLTQRPRRSTASKAARAAAIISKQNRKTTAAGRNKYRKKLEKLGGVYKDLARGVLASLLILPPGAGAVFGCREPLPRRSPKLSVTSAPTPPPHKPAESVHRDENPPTQSDYSVPTTPEAAELVTLSPAEQKALQMLMVDAEDVLLSENSTTKSLFSPSEIYTTPEVPRSQVVADTSHNTEEAARVLFSCTDMYAAATSEKRTTRSAVLAVNKTPTPLGKADSAAPANKNMSTQRPTEECAVGKLSLSRVMLRRHNEKSRQRMSIQKSLALP